MNTYAKLYWLTRLDYLQGLFLSIGILALLSIIAIFIYCEASTDGDYGYRDEKLTARIAFRKKLRLKIRWILPTGIFFFFLNILTPSQNEAIFIVAGGKTIDFIKSDSSINKIPEQTTKIVSDFLQKQIENIHK
jgi:hypothetical protein